MSEYTEQQIPGECWSSETGPLGGANSAIVYQIGAFSNANEVCAADVDSDGDLDVAATNDEGEVNLWENTDGTGTTWSGRAVGTSSDNYGLVFPVDLDLDGDIDLAAGAKWFENSDGLGETWVVHTIASSGDPSSMSVADIDDDSDKDVIMSYSYTNKIYWYENLDGTGTQWSSHQISVPPFQNGAQVSTGDIDDDGDNDIALFERDDVLFLVFCWLENTDGEGGSWQNHILEDCDDYCWDLHATDLDLDGDVDLLSACSNGVWFHENLDGQGGSWSFSEIGTSAYDTPREVETSDFDLDGDSDVAIAYWYGSSNLVWWQNLDGAAGQWLDHDLGTAFAVPDGLCTGDINGDGKGDIVIASSSEISWIELDSEGASGGGNPASLELLPVSPNPSTGSATVRFGMPAAGMICMSIFDASGRRVRSDVPSEYQPGWHSLQLDGLLPGIYFVRVRVGESEAAGRFVVIE